VSPVAILRTSALVGYFVPADAVSSQQHRVATIDEVMESLASRRDITQPVLGYLKDK
jgi:antitoxin StbD